MQQQTYEVSRDEDAYGSSQQLHLKHVYTNYPGDDPDHEFILTLPGVRQPPTFPITYDVPHQKTREPQVLELRLSTIAEVLDVLGRYFADADAPEEWTIEYLKGNKDKRLQVLQWQAQLAEQEEELHRTRKYLEACEQEVRRSRELLAKSQAELGASDAD